MTDLVAAAELIAGLSIFVAAFVALGNAAFTALFVAVFAPFAAAIPGL